MSRLSPRQIEIGRLVAEDLADKEIAQILRISVRTVQEHLDRIGAKIGVVSSDYSRRRAITRWIREHEMPSSQTPNAA